MQYFENHEKLRIRHNTSHEFNKTDIKFMVHFDRKYALINNYIEI